MDLCLNIDTTSDHLKWELRPPDDRYVSVVNFKPLIDAVNDKFKIYFENISRYIMINLNSQNYTYLKSLFSNNDMIIVFKNKMETFIKDQVTYISTYQRPQSFEDYLKQFTEEYNDIISHIFKDSLRGPTLLKLDTNIFSYDDILAMQTIDLPYRYAHNNNPLSSASRDLKALRTENTKPTQENYRDAHNNNPLSSASRDLKALPTENTKPTREHYRNASDPQEILASRGWKR
jgi:hypothetical protein